MKVKTVLWGFTPARFIFVKTIKFQATFDPFYCAKLKTKFLERIQRYEVTPFSGPKWPIDIFFEKTIIIIFMYLLAPFIFQISKKSLGWIQSYEDVPFLSQKLSICPKWEFFQKNHWSNFNVPLCFFHEAKFQKTPYSRSKVMRMCHF